MMTIAAAMAKNLRSIYFGKNWVGGDLDTTLADVTWEQANQRVGDCNPIGTLLFHMTYYVRGLNHAFDHGELLIKDKWSFDHEPITGPSDWESMIASAREDVESFCSKIEKMSNDELDADFLDGKYGTVYQNLAVCLEHCQYHLGQIILLKKMIQ